MEGRKLMKHKFYIGLAYRVFLGAIILVLVHSSVINAGEWKFIVFGDSRGDANTSGVNEDILGKLAVAVAAENPEFVLFPGDLIYGHADRDKLGDEGAINRLEQEYLTWVKVMQPIYQKNIPVLSVRGNHETTQRSPDHEGFPDHRPIWERSREAWDKVFTGKYAMPGNGPIGEKNVTFSYIYNNALVIGMDVYTPYGEYPVNADGSVSTHYVHRVNQAWLDTTLQNNTLPHVFVFTHEAAFKLDHKDCLHGDNSYGLDLSKERDLFWNSMRRAGVRAYFCGHDHSYVNTRIDDGDGNPDNDIHQLVLATAGAGKNVVPVYDGYNGAFTPVHLVLSRTYGYMLVVVDGAKVVMSYYGMADEDNVKFKKLDEFRYEVKRSMNNQ
jgi:hypothetical protein